MCQISYSAWHNPCGCINSLLWMSNVTSWMLIYVLEMNWALIRLLHEILAISSFHIAGSLQMCFHKRVSFFLISLTKRGEFMKSLTLSWELWEIRQPTVLSHGLIFHQCAIHISLTENVLHLKGYEMKEEKKPSSSCCWELLNIDIIHPSTPLFLSFCLAPSPPSTQITFLCFVLKPPSQSLLLLRNHLPLGYKLSMMHFAWYWNLAYPGSCSEFVVEESNWQLATEDLMLRWSDDRKTYQHLTMIHCERACICGHTRLHTHINPTFTWWAACYAGITVHWNGKHSHL